ncbi:hypothetical protein IEI94_05745 [Halomonas sp. ML-15]|uniref:hypothetical protein n=1 Tax=Halomonas sp. ML-15 TaxID=2773305 RepID=UPI001746DDEB|nr:hypothetical protein [Halomonas sp. ML-15]MBD3895349.1 hypothetical protein [Halomonas sp. ML-15]
MSIFLSIIISFPTVVFTVLLCVAVIYWLVSLSGMVDGDVLDGDVGGDGAVDFGGLLATLGLQGVPLPLMVTLLSLTGWLLSYFADLWLGVSTASGWLSWLLGIVLLLASLVGALFATAILIRPLRPLFVRAYHKPQEKQLIGTLCTIRSGSVGLGSGSADVHVDGSHLILQVRSDSALARGDQAVLIEYLLEEQAYWVVPEKEFHTG